MKFIATLPCLMSVSKTNVQGRVKATYAVRMVQRFGPNILFTAALILVLARKHFLKRRCC